MRTFGCLIIAVSLLAALPARAQSPADLKKAALEEMLSVIEKSSRELGKTIRDSRVNGILDPHIKPMTYQWYAQIDTATQKIQRLGIDLRPHLEYMRNVIAAGSGIPSLVASMAADVSGSENWSFEYFVAGRENEKGRFDQQTNGQCREIYGASCRTVLERVAVAVNRYKSDYKEYSTGRVLKTLELYSDKWGDYFSQARSQTFLELAVNSYLYRDEVTRNTFVQPPSYQVTLLHPGILLEYVDNAEDGNKLNEAVALEWVGINWWDDRNFLRYPWGISVISVYADRSDVDDFGIGMMLHVNNKYSFGVSWRDGDTGYYATLDMLKLFEDKKSNFEKYKQKVESYIK